MGCSGKNCKRDSCPSLYMSCAEWAKCRGTVFQIYRMKGAGPVRVGDVVGFYYPAGRNWLSLAAGVADRRTCPGIPTVTHGFANKRKWSGCWGEVFRIYARGRSSGDVIYEHDDVMLYYVNKRQWVGLVGNNRADLRSCPGTTLPPPVDKYECYGEVFELWKQ